MLIYGHWGAPAMGLAGSGWSTSLARVYMALVLLVAIAVAGAPLGMPGLRAFLAAGLARACANCSRWAFPRPVRSRSKARCSASSP